METTDPCKGCIHYYGAYAINQCCNYIFDVGHRRPCPPGTECTVKKRRGRGRPRKHHIRIAATITPPHLDE